MTSQELFARLAEGHAARVTVVTPNTRLAQGLQAEFDAFQMAHGKTVWEAPDILPLSAFVERTWEEAHYVELQGIRAENLPVLLTSAQEQLLWEQILERADLLVTGEAAAQCRRAWQLVHAWRVRPGGGNDDAHAFAEWAARYEELARGSIDAARLPDRVASLLAERNLRKPKLLVAYAFDILPPQTQAFLDACSAAGVELARCAADALESSATRSSFASAREELESAARWARARLEHAGGAAPRIGVVVPDLEQRRAEVVRVFARTMQPAYNLPGASRTGMPFNVSLGLPLAQYPLVRAALALIELSVRELPFEAVSALVRSPFLAGAESEMALRVRLDARLRREAPASLSAAALLARIEGCPRLRGALERVYALGRPEAQAPHAWARHFSALLEAAGFPGERTLDSAEFQARGKLHEVLGELARLDRVAKRLGLARAFGVLRRLCTDTLFQPESGGAPVQVLGILESAGARFDHLWVCGLTDEAWPLDARPNPFLSIAAQQAAGIPEASPEGSAALDRRITEGWLRAAREVVLSCPRKEEDRELSPSPLILQVPEKAIEVPVYPRLRNVVFERKRIDSVEDRVAPAVTAAAVAGGTRVLADQAACPFRAFAHHRLRAERLQSPAEGLDAAERGTLLHALMKHLWSFLKDSSSIDKHADEAVPHAAALAVKELGLEGRFAELERARLERLAREWLALDARRGPFEVVALEKKTTLSVAGLEMSGRIDRMDRVPEGHILLDYKTSRAPSPKHWEPPRPDDPQLPLYAIAAEDVCAVAFAKVRPGDMKYMGFAKTDRLIPNVKLYRDWDKLLGDWRAEAESLGAAFKSGEACVDPKRELATCRYCDLHTLCRVYEKLNALKELEEGAE